jgi:hypothetical protein
MKECKCKSFQLAGFRATPEIESHENWAILSLFLLNLTFWYV